MCGIAGFNFEVNKEFVFNRLYHRGPDNQGYFNDNSFSFFHTRLAIQDVKHANQPFFYQNYMIVFNGEIYNHLELRKNLNVNFKTSSDTETLLHLYIRYKEKMFEYIDGMFAFCIYDLKRKKLFLARDRAGKKPLYIYKKGRNFGFASEINVFKFLNLREDEEDIKFFLSTGFCESGYEEIREFPPGCCGYFDKELKIKRYFDIYPLYKKEKNVSIEELLKKSVKDRLLSSDVEVGAFLSGGIDSGLIVAMASEHKRIKTFTVKFSGEFDESYLAKLVAKKYNTKHYVIEIDMDVKNYIEKIILNYGKPFFDSSAVPSYFVSREARKYVKVVLNGDGADELFAGYRRYVPLYYNLDKLFRPFFFLEKYINPQKRGFLMFLYRLLRVSKKEGIEWYNVLLNDLFVDLYKLKGEKIEKTDKFIKKIDLNSFERLLYLDFILNLRYDLLPKMDIASMSNSLEARSPFLSRYMLETAPLLKNKIKNFKTKYILRELGKKYLPKEIVEGKKRGFEVPLIKWVNEDLKDMIMDYLSFGFYKNFIEEKFVQNLINRKINIPEEKRAKILYLLFTLEVWKNG